MIQVARGTWLVLRIRKIQGDFAGGLAAVSVQARDFVDRYNAANPKAHIAEQKVAINNQDGYVRINLKAVPAKM